MAYLSMSFSRAFADELADHNFSYERRYFGKSFDAAAYGAGGREICRATESGQPPARRGNRSYQRPLCALDIGRKKPEPAD